MLHVLTGIWLTEYCLRCRKLLKIHFEESQFESRRADEWKKLKPNAIPTLFDVPNPPPMIDPHPRKSLFKTNAEDFQYDTRSADRCNNNYLYADFPSPDLPNPPINLDTTKLFKVEDEHRNCKKERDHLLQQIQSLQDANARLKKENADLCSKLQKHQDILSKFLNSDQLKVLEEGRISSWTNESIIKGLKFRFALSVHGYEYLRNSGYPLPGYSTLMRHIQDLKLNFGIFEDIIEILKYKVQSMDRTDRYCVLSYDEMFISEQRDFNKNTGKFAGYVTLGNQTDDLGQKVFVVVARGLKTKWKQVIACHVTPREHVDPFIIKTFLQDCILQIQSCGLHVLALSSDLDGRNRSLWTAWNINISQFATWSNSFIVNGHEIYAIPDVCHLLKNLKAALLSQTVFLPLAYVEQQNLPTNVVEGSHVKTLWEYEISHGCEKRLLHHIRQQDINPSTFDKMNVGAAVRFFSPKTAGALRTGVKMEIIPEVALTTADFIDLVYKWFTLLSSKVRKVSITSRNCDRNYIFLHSVIDVFHNTIFGKGWKPLNYGIVLATLSFTDMAEVLFRNGFDFVLGHRFTQDATENIFSQIRR